MGWGADTHLSVCGSGHVKTFRGEWLIPVLAGRGHCIKSRDGEQLEELGNGRRGLSTGQEGWAVRVRASGGQV